MPTPRTTHSRAATARMGPRELPRSGGSGARIGRAGFGGGDRDWAAGAGSLGLPLPHGSTEPATAGGTRSTVRLTGSRNSRRMGRGESGDLGKVFVLSRRAWVMVWCERGATRTAAPTTHLQTMSEREKCHETAHVDPVERRQRGPAGYRVPVH